MDEDGRRKKYFCAKDEDGRRKKYFCAKIEVETIEEKDIVRCSGKQDEPDGNISDRVVSDPYDWLGTLS